MNKTNKLKEFIKKLVKEYTGTGASGGNATDGNNITSPRPFADDLDEMENYIYKNVYGGEGGQTVGDTYTGNYPNRHPNTMFESEDEIRKHIRNEIRKHYELDVFFGSKIKNYKELAAIYTLIESYSNKSLVNTTQIINNKITLLEHLTKNKVSKKDIKKDVLEEFSSYDKDTRILTYKVLLEKFNSKYDKLSNEQKNVLKELYV